MLRHPKHIQRIERRGDVDKSFSTGDPMNLKPNLFYPQ
jgi:hypothetical protein